MYAKVIIKINDKPCICTIDGNSPMNYYKEDGCIKFKIEGEEFYQQFYSSSRTGSLTILGRPFIEKYIKCMDYEHKVVILNTNTGETKLDIFNEIPNNALPICISVGENECIHFLAIVDINQKNSIISLETLDKIRANTTLTSIKLKCCIYEFKFNHTFIVMNNDNRYVVLGLDFLSQYISRIGKKYLQTKSQLRLPYI